MSSWGVVVSPGVLDWTDLADQVEEWLQRQTKPQQPVIWSPESGETFLVHDMGELTGHLIALGRTGDWGALSRGDGVPWGQSMRVEDGWIVEVDGGTGPDNFARRVQRVGEPVGDLRRACAGEWFRGVSYLGDESFASALEAARVLWGWVNGGLPAGYSLRDLVDGVD